MLIVSIAVLLVLILISIIQKNGLKIKFLNIDDNENKSDGKFWNAITLQVMKRPYMSMLLATGLLIFLSYFYFDLEKGTSGISVLPEDEPVKIGFELLDEKFGFGQDAPATIVIDADINSPDVESSILNLEKQLIEDEGFNSPEITV